MFSFIQSDVRLSRNIDLKIMLITVGTGIGRRPICMSLSWIPKEAIITINHTVDYMARGFMIFMRGIDITWGIGRVLLKVSPVLGPKIARA